MLDNDVAPPPPPDGDEIAVVAPGRIVGTDQTLTQALLNASPGDVFVLGGGDYDPVDVSGVNGTSAQPIIIRAVTDANPPVFSTHRYHDGPFNAGIELANSNFVEIHDVHVRHSLWGILVDNSSDIVLDDVDVENIGQEAVRVRAEGNNAISERIEIRNSRIGDTGNRPDDQHGSYIDFGEGIYLGDGNSVSSGGEVVRDVTIERNEIFGTTSEAIDVKATVRDVTIRDNTIYDIDTGTTGAVVIHADGTRNSNGTRVGDDPEIVVIGNDIRDVTRRTDRYSIGSAIVTATHAHIENNTIHNVQH